MQEFGAILTRDGYWTLVSVDDFAWLAEKKWNTHASPNAFTQCKRNPGSLRYVVSSRGERMHRLILGAPKGMQVDHINHDTLDNRRENIRIVTASENMRNTRDQLRADGLPRGVYQKKSQYRLEIRRNRKKLIQRYFNTVEEAVLFRDGFLSCEKLKY